jgi:hypothetical protein
MGTYWSSFASAASAFSAMARPAAMLRKPMSTIPAWNDASWIVAHLARDAQRLARGPFRLAVAAGLHVHLRQVRQRFGQPFLRVQPFEQVDGGLQRGLGAARLAGPRGRRVFRQPRVRQLGRDAARPCEAQQFVRERERLPVAADGRQQARTLAQGQRQRIRIRAGARQRFRARDQVQAARRVAIFFRQQAPRHEGLRAQIGVLRVVREPRRAVDQPARGLLVVHEFRQRVRMRQHGLRQQDIVVRVAAGPLGAQCRVQRPVPVAQPEIHAARLGQRLAQFAPVAARLQCVEPAQRFVRRDVRLFAHDGEVAHERIVRAVGVGRPAQEQQAQQKPVRKHGISRHRPQIVTLGNFKFHNSTINVAYPHGHRRPQVVSSIQQKVIFCEF